MVRILAVESFRNREEVVAVAVVIPDESVQLPGQVGPVWIASAELQESAQRSRGSERIPRRYYLVRMGYDSEEDRAQLLESAADRYLVRQIPSPE